MNKWNILPSDTVIAKTKKALEENGIEVIVVETAEDAKSLVSSRIPQKAQVMTMTSKTLEATGIEEMINESGLYDATKKKLMKMDRNTDGQLMQQLGAASEYAIGSVHAVTEDGKIFIASNSGSQLPGYAYGSSHVIWVVGVQKIVKNADDAMKRIYEYVLPLESKRAHEAYGVDGSFVSKVLMFNREVPGRITIILVKETRGF